MTKPKRKPYVPPLSAGRELDVLIAEKVMGCRVLVSRGALENDISVRCGCSEVHPHEQSSGEVVRYSTDIAAAFEVVGTHLMELHCNGSFGWTCRWLAEGPSEQDMEAKADTAPLAICLAALKAVRV